MLKHEWSICKENDIHAVNMMFFLIFPVILNYASHNLNKEISMSMFLAKYKKLLSQKLEWIVQLPELI